MKRIFNNQQTQDPNATIPEEVSLISEFFHGKTEIISKYWNLEKTFSLLKEYLYPTLNTIVKLNAKTPYSKYKSDVFLA